MKLDHILNKKLDKSFLIELFQEQTEVFDCAIQIALTNQQPTAWRATWILAHCTKKNDARIKPFISNFIQKIGTLKDGHQREILKILAKATLSEVQEGRLFDICMTIWESPNKSPSVRYMAFKHLFKTCQKYPDLNNELTFITQEKYLESLSPGVKQSICNVIKTRK